MAPYSVVIGRSGQVRHRMLQVLLDSDFQTELSLEEEPTYNRYATIVAAVEGDCRALRMLHSYRAAFPKLEEDSVEQLMTAIDNRRQEKLAEQEDDSSDSDDEEELCDMPAYLRQLRLIRG